MKLLRRSLGTPTHAALLWAAAALAASPAAAVTLTRGPYLQLVTTRSALVVWTTDVPADCALTLGPVGGSATVLTGPSASLCALPVTGLDPGTEYAYVPLANAAPLAGESVFHTDDPSRPFSFLVLGDSGTGSAKQRVVRDRMLATPTDLIVHAGDMVYEDGAAEDFNPKYFRPYRDLLRRLVLWPSLGNHDVHPSGGAGAPWRAAFYTPANNPAGSENYYSFDWGNAHFVVLNSNASLAPNSAQYTFLDQDLAQSTALWKFVVFHHTIYSSGIHGSSLAIRGNLAPLLDRHAVDLVLMGHDHHYERTLPLRAGLVVEPGAGTVYVTTGGGGQSIRSVGTSSFTAYAESAFHFTRVAVNGGGLLLQMIREDGAVRDWMTLEKGSAPPPAPRCSDGLVNRPVEQCDGPDRFACYGPCAADCTCQPMCGDGLVNQPAESCDGSDDAACPGLCLSTCGCGDASRFVELPAIADTYIEAGAEATWDHGAATHLDVDLSPAGLGYLKFDLPSLPTPIERATLRLWCSNSSPDGGTAYPVGDSGWIEGDRNGLDALSAGGPGLKWTEVDTSGNGKVDASDASPWVPDFDHPLGSVSPLAGEPATIEVTGAFQRGPGLYSLALKNDSTDGATYSTREHLDADRHPRLRLELAPSTATTTTTVAPTTTTTTLPPAALGVVQADATVKATAPAANFGADPQLELDADPAKRTFIRLQVTGVGSRPVALATLRLQVANVSGAPSDSGGRVRAVPGCAWSELGVTWDTQPAVAPDVLDTKASVAAGGVVDFDLMPAISGDGVYCFVLDTLSTNGVIYNAREASAGRPLVFIGTSPAPTTTTTATTSTTTTTLGPPRTTVEADVTVDESAAGENFGASPLLQLDGEPRKLTLVRVLVSGVGGRRVAGARLRLEVADVYGAPSDSGGRIRPVPSCAWSESGVTWSSQPTIGATVLGTVGAVARGEVAEFDVTAAIPGDGVYCFALDTLSINGVAYDAREGVPAAPTLAIDLGS